MTAIVRQIRTATLWALAFSAGAAVCGLGLPLAVAHALAAVETGDTPGMLPLLGVAVAALALRGAFMTARSRILSRVALWARHAAGADILAHGLDAVRTPNALDADRERLERVTGAIAHLGALLDGLLVILPLMLLFALQPMIGGITVAAIVIGGAMAVAVTLGSAQRNQDNARAHLEAASAWRAAAASSVFIAARGMTASTVNEWQSLHGRAISQAYLIARDQEKADTLLRHLQMVAIVCALASSVWIVGGTTSIAVIAAALLLQITCLSTVMAAAGALAVVRAAAVDLEQLAAPSQTSGHAQRGEQTGTARAPQSNYAEAS